MSNVPHDVVSELDMPTDGVRWRWCAEKFVGDCEARELRSDSWAWDDGGVGKAARRGIGLSIGIAVTRLSPS